MGVEIIAVASFGLTTLGAVLKLYRHIDVRLDLLQLDRESLKADMRMLEYRMDRLEHQFQGQR